MAHSPGLKRIDGEKLDKLNEREAFQRISLTVDSVHFYKDPDTFRRLSAVLLTIGFELDEGEYLRSAKIPLVAIDMPAKQETSTSPAQVSISTSINPNKPQTPTQQSPERVPQTSSVDILGSYPFSDEYVRVNGLNVNKTDTRREGLLSMKPETDDKSTMEQDMFIISLSPQRRKIDERTTLSWVFRGEKNAIYPNNIHLLVIVCGPGESGNNDSNSHVEDTTRPFAFRLWLQQDLEINVYDIVRSRKKSNVGRPLRLLPFRRVEGDQAESRDGEEGAREQQGWCFDIEGPYDPKKAENALNSTRSSSPEVGLLSALLKSTRPQAGAV